MLANVTVIYSPLWLVVPAIGLLASIILWRRTRSASASLQLIGALAFLVWSLHVTVLVLMVEEAASIQRTETISFWVAVTVFPVGYLWHALRAGKRI